MDTLIGVGVLVFLGVTYLVILARELTEVAIRSKDKNPWNDVRKALLDWLISFVDTAVGLIITCLIVSWMVLSVYLIMGVPLAQLARLLGIGGGSGGFGDVPSLWVWGFVALGHVLCWSGLFGRFMEWTEDTVRYYRN